MLTRLEERLLLSARQLLRQRHEKVQELGGRLRHPRQQLQEQAQRLDDLELRLQQRIQQQIAARREQLEQFRSRLHASRPDYRIGQHQQRVTDLGERLHLSINNRLRRERERYRGLVSQLDLVSPWQHWIEVTPSPRSPAVASSATPTASARVTPAPATGPWRASVHRGLGGKNFLRCTRKGLTAYCEHL